MICKLIIGVLALTLPTKGTTDYDKFNELYDKYEQCYKKQDFSGSVICLEEALKYISQDSTACFSDTYNGLAFAYWRLGRYTKAIDYGLLALECDRQMNDSSCISRSLSLLAAIFTHQRRYSDAERYMRDAIDMVPYGDTRVMAARCATLGEILTVQNKCVEAVENIEKSYSLDSAAGRSSNAAIRLSQLGAAYLQMGNYVKAEGILEEAGTELEAAGNNSSLCINMIAQTKMYKLLKRNSKAEETAMACLRLSTSIGQRKTKLEAIKLLAEIRQSPELYTQAMALNDSLYDEQIQTQIAEFEVQYATSEKEKENAQLMVIIERQRHTLTLLIIVIAVILAGMVFVFVVHRMRRDMQHTEMMARRFFVDKAEPTCGIDDNQKNENENLPKDGQDEDERSTDVNAEMKLSAREIEIVRYCCQGLISKEIADKLGISKRTVDNHKSAIYHKIGVNNNTELILFAAKHSIIDL